MDNDIIIGQYRLIGGGQCPEQYDVFCEDKEVGYLRLRHGKFRADAFIDGKDMRGVYVAFPVPDGEDIDCGGFSGDEERRHFLLQAVAAIDDAIYQHAHPVTDTGGLQDTD